MVNGMKQAVLSDNLISCHSPQGKKWLTYLLVSVLVNMLMLSQIDVKSHSREWIQMSMLNVSISSLSSAKAVKAIEKKQSVKTHQSDKALIAASTIKKAAQFDTPPVIAPKQQAKEVLTSSQTLAHHQGDDDSTIIHEARYRHQTPPIYPSRAIELGMQGEVNLHVRVLENGYPQKLKIAKSSGYPLLDRAAMAAVRKWQFEPLTINGSMVQSWVNVPVNFVIN